ncbi:MAG: nucleoside 2-deoxyribosyltransferase domain-containing protein [Clostridia bacterium]
MANNNVYIAPENSLNDSENFKIFLAGTIDNGSSDDWQQNLINYINNNYTDIDIYNPRRSFCDIEQGSKEFKEQVDWELDHLNKCDLILMNILRDSKSPISLLEMGLFANSRKMLVVCEPGFYRYDNVKIVCERYHIPLYNHISELLFDIEHLLLK